jgi:hypothetical protein
VSDEDFKWSKRYCDRIFLLEGAAGGSELFKYEIFWFPS